jgi:prevent-host-death family protein
LGWRHLGGPDHGVARDELGKLRFAHALGARGTLGQDEVANRRRRIPDAELDPLADLDPQLAEQAAWIDNGACPVTGGLVPDRRETEDRPRRISVSSAKGRLTELVRRAEAGDEVVLTRRGEAAVRLVPVKAPVGAAARRKLLQAVRTAGAAKAGAGASAARSQDFLYDADGLPR